MVYIKETRMFKAEKEGGISVAFWRVKKKGESFDIEPIGSPFFFIIISSIGFSQWSFEFMFVIFGIKLAQ